LISVHSVTSATFDGVTTWVPPRALDLWGVEPSGVQALKNPKPFEGCSRVVLAVAELS